MRATWMVLLVACLTSTSFAQEAVKVDARALADRSALVVVMCEDGGKTPTGRLMDRAGKALLEPFVKQYYARRAWLTSEAATTEAFLGAVRDAAKEKDVVDCLLFLHGSADKSWFADGPLPSAAMVAGLKGRGGDKLRMVYTTACYSDTVLAAWTEVGTWAVRGMKGENRPLDFPRFWLGWIQGEDYARANARAFATNEALHGLANDLRPRLTGALARLEKRLGGGADGKPSALAGLAAKARTRWFAQTWDIEESRPKVVGGEARIDRTKTASPR